MLFSQWEDISQRVILQTKIHVFLCHLTPNYRLGNKLSVEQKQPPPQQKLNFLCWREIRLFLEDFRNSKENEKNRIFPKVLAERMCNWIRYEVWEDEEGKEIKRIIERFLTLATWRIILTHTEIGKWQKKL